MKPADVDDLPGMILQIHLGMNSIATEPLLMKIHKSEQFSCEHKKYQGFESKLSKIIGMKLNFDWDLSSPKYSNTCKNHPLEKKTWKTMPSFPQKKRTIPFPRIFHTNDVRKSQTKVFLTRQTVS